MKNTYAVAKLIAWDIVRIIAYSDVRIDKVRFDLIVDGERVDTIAVNKATSLGGVYFYEIKLGKPLELGHDYAFSSSFFGILKLDISEAAQFDDFDEKYAYLGDDLGATYHKDYCEFVLWAPLASSVLLRLNDGKEKRYVEMKREKRGVYRYRLNGDHDGLRYLFVVTNNGVTRSVIDPYAKSSTLNSKESVVIDLNKVNIDTFDDNLPKLNRYNEAIIYECHVRDMTIHPNTDINHKGQFLGMIEKNRHSKGGNKVGFDYLKALGVTHLQLQPVLDYATVNEEDPNEKYNWGYDPKQYFTLEGSFASNKDDPYSRIIDFKKLVREYHKAKIGIILDVVYNHVYEVETSTLENIVPNYYFRLNNDGKRTSCSGCGNDLASERVMARKLIVDSVTYLFKNFHIDGLRFDLMSLIDVKTINECYNAAKKYKKDVIMYGEGWEMGAMCRDNTPLASTKNAHLLPHIGFFNDAYRNTNKGVGNRFPLDKPGYLFGNKDFLKGYEYAYVGSCIDQCYPKLFNSTEQSINFIECHDDGALIDYLTGTNYYEDEEVLLERLRLCNKCLLLSFGVPFIQMGQEIGQSKMYKTNTYNAGDEYNRFDVDLLDKRQNLLNSFISYVAMRKRFDFLYETRADVIDKMVDYNENNGNLEISVHPINGKYKTVKIFINASKEILYPHLDGDYKLYITSKKDEPQSLVQNNPIIGPISATIFYR